MKSERKRPIYIDDSSLLRAYTVESVARIAAGIVGPNLSPEDRIDEALKLIRAAEARACPPPDPWEEQHWDREPGDELGDLPDREEDKRIVQRQQIADSLISSAKVDGKILRNLLALAASRWVGGWNNADEAERRFLKWADSAAVEMHWRESLRESCPQDEEGNIDSVQAKKWVESFIPPKKVDRRKLLSRFEEKRGKSMVIKSEDLARELLLGSPDFMGLLKFLYEFNERTAPETLLRRRKGENPGSFVSPRTRGSNRGDSGQFE